MRHPASALAAFALLVLPAALAAQTPASTSAASRPAGCRGTLTQASSVSSPLPGPDGQPIVIPSYSIVTEVYENSPAAAAGIKTGDMVLRQDGRDLVADPPSPPRLAGDTVELTVLRDGVILPITVVLGRWDPVEQVGDQPRVSA
jgi:S1-C subfamily serine protease